MLTPGVEATVSVDENVIHFVKQRNGTLVRELVVLVSINILLNRGDVLNCLRASRSEARRSEAKRGEARRSEAKRSEARRGISNRWSLEMGVRGGVYSYSIRANWSAHQIIGCYSHL